MNYVAPDQRIRCLHRVWLWCCLYCNIIPWTRTMVSLQRALSMYHVDKSKHYLNYNSANFAIGLFVSFSNWHYTVLSSNLGRCDLKVLAGSQCQATLRGLIRYNAVAYGIWGMFTSSGLKVKAKKSKTKYGVCILCIVLSCYVL